jgi:predicted nucleotidyltransferase
MEPRTIEPAPPFCYNERAPNREAPMLPDTAQLLERIKLTIHAVEPAANITLFGSRARQTAGPESDWDLLVLLDDEVDTARKRRIRHALYELEWETGEILCSTIKSRMEWDSPRIRITPFYANVSRDGVAL